MAERTMQSAINEPTQPFLTFRGEKVTPGMILRLWRSGQRMKPQSRRRILKTRSWRRVEPESLTQLSSRWARQNPEAAARAQAVLHERVSLEREQIARIGAVEPEFKCEPLGFLKTDDDNAEAKEAYLEEWRVSPNGPPVQVYFGKGTEDGEYGRVRLPAHLDMDGCPDFFEYLSERAYNALPDDEDKKAYQKDDGDRRGRYVKLDKDGKKVKNPDFDKGDDEASKAAHEEAVQRYLLDKWASHGRVIPALDCAPIFSRGKGRDRWELTALVERSLHYIEELLEGEEGYGVQGWRMGDRKLIPMAYNSDGTNMRLAATEIGSGDQHYVYTAYLMCRDEDGRKRPVIASTIGGSASWDASSGDPDDKDSAILLDLYEEFKRPDGSSVLEGHPLWSYHFGLHTEDDDPDHYAQPWVCSLIPTCDRIEDTLTAINAATAVNAFTGHFYRPDAQLAEIAEEAFIEQDGDLKRPRMPKPGEIEAAGGEIFPAQQAVVGNDAWRQLEQDRLALQMAVAVDQPSSGGASGHAMVVGESLAKTGKRHIREGALEAVIRDGEDHLRILHAIFERYDVKWPLQTVQERPVGKLGEKKSGHTIVQYEPEWIGDGSSYRLTAEYPEEQNLARQDMEVNLAKNGFGSFKRVAAAMGEKDTQRARIEVLKDMMWRHPAYLDMAMLGVAQARGDRTMVQILKQLQAEQKITAQGVPGAPNGVPTAMLNGPGAQKALPPGPGGVNGGMGASARGGQMAAERGADTLVADAEAQMGAA